MGAELLWTFFSRRVKPLCQLFMTMWMYPGPSCHDHPFSEELGDMELNTQIDRVLALGAYLNHRVGPTPLREGVDNAWVSPLRPILGCLCKFWFLNTFMLLRRVSGVLTTPLKESPCSRMR
jgi:hypothetical protein